MHKPKCILAPLTWSVTLLVVVKWACTFTCDKNKSRLDLFFVHFAAASSWVSTLLVFVNWSIVVLLFFIRLFLKRVYNSRLFYVRVHFSIYFCTVALSRQPRSVFAIQAHEFLSRIWSHPASLSAFICNFTTFYWS